MKWLHRADRGLHTIDIMSMAVTRSAAAKKIRIYHVNGYLPALKNNANDERRIGILTENAELGLSVSFGIDDPGEIHTMAEAAGMTYYRLGYNLLQRKTQRSLFYLDTLEHYAEYMRFMGQNVHAMGTYMYLKEQRGGYDPPYPIKTAALSNDVRDIALRVFEQNNIHGYSNIEYIYHWGLVNEPEVSFYGGSTEEYRPRNKTGDAPKVGYSKLNIAHPRVQEAFLFAMDQITDRFSKSPVWKGLLIFGAPKNTLPLFPSEIKDYSTPNESPLDFDYSDATIAAFEFDNPGIVVPGSGSGRYAERYNFLTSPSMRDTWIDWKANYSRNIILQLRDIVKSYRPDLVVMQVWYPNFEEVYHWLKDGTKTYTEHAREFGIDPTLYTNDADVWSGPVMFPTEHNKQANIGIGYAYFTRLDYYTAGWEHQVRPEVISAFDTNDKRIVMMYEGWQERNHLYMEGNDPAVWPIVGRNIARFHSRFNEDYSQETFVQSMAGIDPQIIIHGYNDLGLGVQHGQEMRDFNKVMTSLPGERFQKVLNTDLTTNLVIREFQDGGTYWFYVVNPGYWPATGTLDLNSINGVTDIATGQVISTSGGSLDVSLEPYGIAGFKATTSNGEIPSYTINPLSDDDLEHMRTIIHLAEETYHDVSSILNPRLSAYEENLIPTVANQAKQDIANREYASAWSKLTDWEYWIIVYNKILGVAEVAPKINEEQTGNLTLRFDGSSSMSYHGPIVLYEWDFGDGNTDSGEVVSHTYPSNGTYTISLTATTNESARPSYSRTFLKDVLVRDNMTSIEGDLNNDGDVNILDLGIVSLDFGRTSGFDIRADTNSDNEVDIFDIVFIASRFT